MPAPLSIDLRQRIIAAYEAKESSQRQLTKQLKVSLSFRSLTIDPRNLVIVMDNLAVHHASVIREAIEFS